MEQLPLVGLIEIAQRAGVQRPVVSHWRRRHADFPSPVADLKIGPIFWWPFIEKWLLDSGRDVLEIPKPLAPRHRPWPTHLPQQ